MLISSLSIRVKLLILLVLPIIALIAVLLISLSELKRSHEGLENVYHNRVVPLKNLKVIADDYAVLIIDTANKVNAGLMDSNEAISNLDAATARIKEKWADYLSLTHSPEEKRLSKEAEQFFGPANDSISAFRSFLAANQGTNLAGKLDKYDGPLYATIDPIGEKITDLVNYHLTNTQKTVDTLDKAHEKNFTLLLMISGILIAVLALLGYFIYQSIRQPIEHLR